MIMKSPPSKALIIRINLIFIAFFLVVYATLLLRPSSSAYHQNSSALVRCSLRECHHKVRLKMKAVIEEAGDKSGSNGRNLIKREKPSFLNEMQRGMKIGMVNMEDEDLSEWKMQGKVMHISYDRVSELLEWQDLYPEWIDEEEEIDGPSCPEIPMPRIQNYGYMDVIVVKLGCKWPEEGWARDVERLQLHLIAAKMGVGRGRRDRKGRTKIVFLSKCRPMLELFPCRALIKQEGDWWLFMPDVVSLDHKLSLPVGSCNLALPLWGEGNDELYDVSKIRHSSKTTKKAYATVLHSSDLYVCGAITLAHSLLKTGTKHDLILLIDSSISLSNRKALASAGWKIRMITRIRNPKAEKDSYNEYNYSKFRLWQLTDYDKIIFIDSDIIVLLNMDLLFNFPQMTATGNDGSIFNSGIMVIEPSNCTFKILMQRTKEIVSYNGGDQGFLNEVFVWWHRLPRRVNFLKNFWSNNTVETSLKNQLFGSDPPQVYAIHYLGLKPWLCYRDYDCNWDIGDQRVYASDVAHDRWWKLHDSMEQGLQKFCGLSEKRKIELQWDRNLAGKMGLQDQHWKINVTDPRRLH